MNGTEISLSSNFSHCSNTSPFMSFRLGSELEKNFWLVPNNLLLVQDGSVKVFKNKFVIQYEGQSSLAKGEKLPLKIQAFHTGFQLKKIKIMCSIQFLDAIINHSLEDMSQCHILF